MERAQVWHTGEDVAAAHVVELGWTILARNWRCPVGELDIIATDPAAQAVVFCEVKCRRGTSFGLPIEAITRAKVAKLRELALYWLREQAGAVPALRFDAIGVLLHRDGAPTIDHRRGIC